MQVHIDIWRALLLVFVVLFFCLFSLLGLWRHWGYLTSINDLGAFDQVVWMASKGHSLVNTSIFGTPMHWLGFHFQPILSVFVLLYKITPTVNWFVLAQGAALAVSAWPIFLLAERVTASGQAAFMWSLAYLCNPFLLNAAAWDFHPISIAVPLLSLGLLAIERKQAGLLILASILLLACKEHMGLAVAGLGLLYAMRNRAWSMGLGIFLAGIAAFVLILAVIMPSYSLTVQHPMLGDNAGQLSRYSWLGGTPAEVIKTIVLEPILVSRTVVAIGGLEYLFLLLMPFLFLPLGGTSWLLPAAADMLVNLLSANPMPRSIFSYHSAALIPVVTVAAINGGRRLADSVRCFDAVNLSHFVLFTSLILGYSFAPLPLYGSSNFWKADHVVSALDPAVPSIKTVISDGTISAQANIGTHFSQRESVYPYPEKVGKVEYVILRLKSPTQRLRPYNKAAFATLTHHLMMNPSVYLDSVSELLVESRYGVVYWQDPWLVLKRDAVSEANVAQILDKIELLREEWLGLSPQ